MENPYDSKRWKPSDSMGRLRAGGDYRKEVIDVTAPVRNRRVMSKVALLVARKAWGEGKAEQAEIVRGLVEAALEYIRGEGPVSSVPELTPLGLLLRAIDKAKGE